MEESNIPQIAQAFAKEWEGKGNEKQDTQAFWLSLLQNVLEIKDVPKYIEFERKVEISGHTKYIDAYIPATKVLIEQKSIGIDLDAEEKQSDGEMLTPFQQAKRYSDWLDYEERARWIIISNFKEFRIYDMSHPSAPYVSIMLEDLESKYEDLRFICNLKEEFLPDQRKISEAAGEIVGKLYDALREGFADPDDSKSLECLNILCVRLVFLLYAEDSSFLYSANCTQYNKEDKETRNQFRRYMESFSIENMRDGLIKLFRILNTPYDKRSKNERKDLLEFVYVNGGLFSEEFDADLPQFTENSRHILLNECSRGFDWRGLSPTVFGAVFESTLDPKTRRKQGMHYTSPENIQRTIKPLFFDELKKEYETIEENKNPFHIYKALLDFQEKLGKLTFLDPACGSGNFLTETYLLIRNLENDVLRSALHQEDAVNTRYIGEFGGMPRISELEDPIKVKISNFYGIEIEPFAVSVAKTALWIAEMKMKSNTEMILPCELNYFPISSYSHIKRADALKIDWRTFTSSHSLFNIDTGESDDADNTESEPRSYDYIIGNPPFVGARYMDKGQKEDMETVFGKKYPNLGNLDFVCGWYKKAEAVLMQCPDTRCAFVSSNSVIQGNHPYDLWNSIFANGIHIDFAWRQFKWESKSEKVAAVHVVIIGFSKRDDIEKKYIYLGNDERIEAKNINAYLMDAPNIAVQSNPKPLCDVPEIGIGNKPIDGGHYLFTEAEMNEFVKQEPNSQKYFREFLGADEFINGKKRYCLWLGDTKESVIKTMPKCQERVELVRAYRLNSKSEGTVKLAEKPTRFHVENMPKKKYLAIPRVSSENRDYIPMGFLTSKVICSDAIELIPKATLYHFGILTSLVHMAWMRVVCGRLEIDYRYSKNIVYNNFIWCDATEEQTKEIEQTAQGILDVRKKHKDMTLAQMYSRETMPDDLREAHRKNDTAVMKAYGFGEDATESEIVAKLMEMYSAKLK